LGQNRPLSYLVLWRRRDAQSEQCSSGPGPGGLVDLFRSRQIGSSRRGELEDTHEICNTMYILLRFGLRFLILCESLFAKHFQHLKYLKGSWAVLFRSGHIGSSSRGEPLITYEICNIINMLFLKGELESLVFVLKCLLLTFFKVQNTIWLRKACVLDLFWISNIQIIWHPSSCLKCFYPSPSDLNFSSTAPPPPPPKKEVHMHFLQRLQRNMVPFTVLLQIVSFTSQVNS